MIVWKGLGILAVIIPVGIAIIFQFVFGEDTIYSGMGYILGGLIIWFLGKKFNNNNERITVDAKTGRQLVEKLEHSLFWIKLELWSPVFILLGISFAISNITNGKSVDLVFPLIGILLIAYLGHFFYKKVNPFFNSNSLENKNSGKGIVEDTKHENRIKKQRRSAKLKQSPSEGDKTRENLLEEENRKKQFYEEIRNNRNKEKKYVASDHSNFMPKSSNEPKVETKSENIQDSHDNKFRKTDLRSESLSICLDAGFKPSSSLPTEFDKQLRPSIEIANRLHALKALVLWLMVPEENLSSEKVMNFINLNNLKDSMTEDEKAILTVSRDDEKARDSIGWKFENVWPLAWYFGYVEPEITGQMMNGEQIQEIFKNHTCPKDLTIQEWIQNRDTVSEKKLMQKEDLFYCLHNAVRSAQLGGDTVPSGFNPIGNGGVIHERRHSLTWMLSEGVRWEETDLST